MLQYLGLVVGHLLYQRLASKLLGATSEVLGGVGLVWCHDGRPSSCSRMHHCRCARWVMLVWSLLLHVWYCKLTQQNKRMQWETGTLPPGPLQKSRLAKHNTPILNNKSQYREEIEPFSLYSLNMRELTFSCSIHREIPVQC